MAAPRRTPPSGFAPFLNAAMKAAGIPNGNQLAEVTGLNGSMVNRWLRGKSTPSIDNLRELAPHINVRPMDLYVVAGWVLPEEASLEADPMPPTGRHSIEDEIRADPRIRESRKEALIEMLETFREEISDPRTPVRGDVVRNA